MDEQRKFKNLKNRLESMNYRFSFSLDSANLIDALLDDITSLNQSLQRLRIQKSDPEAMRDLSERIEFLNREKNKLESEIQKTSYIGINHDEKDSLLLTISDLRRENKTLSQKLSSSYSGKKDSIDYKNKDYIDKLFVDFSYLKQQLENSEKNSEKLLYEKYCLEDRLKLAESQMANVQKELNLSLMTIKDITNENRSTNEEYNSLKKIISSYESKNELLENESENLHEEIQKLHQYSRSLEQQVSNISKDFSKTRSEVDLISSSKSRLSSQIESLQRQLDILQNENSKLHILRDEERKNLEELEDRCRNLDEAFKTSQEKIRSVQRENQNFCESIREKSENLRSSESQKKSLEKEVKDLKIFTVKYEESQQEISKLKALADGLGSEKKKTKKELSDARSGLKHKEEELKQYRLCYEQTSKDNEVLKRKIEEQNGILEGYSQCMRANNQLEDQLRLSKSQFEDSINREKQLYNEIDQIRTLLKKTEEKLGFSQSQFDMLQSHKTTLEAENSKLQKNYSDLVARNNLMSNELNRLEDRARLSEEEIEELNFQLNSIRQECFSLQDELDDTKKALSSEQSHSIRQADQVKELKEFISSLEHLRNEFAKKVESYQISETEKENLIKKLRDDVGLLKRQCAHSEKLLSTSSIEKDSFAKENKALQYEISQKSEEIIGLKNSVKKNMNDIEDFNTRIESLLENEEHFKKKIRENEVEKTRLTEINIALNLQLDDSKKYCNKLGVQLQEALRNNSFAEGQIRNYDDKYKTLIYEKDSLTSKIEELNKDFRCKTEIFANASKEKEELNQKLRILSEEYDKVVRAYDCINIELKKANGKASAAETLTDTFKRQEEHYIKSIQDLEDKLKNALRTVEISEYKRNDAENTLESLMKEVHSSKNITRDLDMNREELQRKFNVLDKEKSILESKLRSLESELISTRAQLEIERQRSSELEAMAYREKVKYKRFENSEEVF